MNAVLLRIGTGALTFYHYVQELVGFPNQFLPDMVSVPCKDYTGKETLVRTLVYHKLTPNILFLGEDTPTQLLNVHPRDFPLLFSGNREEFLRQDPKRQQVLEELTKIRAMFVQNGLLRIGEIQGCRCGLFYIKEFLDYAVAEQKKLRSKFRDKYTLPNLRFLSENGAYPR